jgi:hypothetical protein
VDRIEGRAVARSSVDRDAAQTAVIVADALDYIETNPDDHASRLLAACVCLIECEPGTTGCACAEAIWERGRDRYGR